MIAAKLLVNPVFGNHGLSTGHASSYRLVLP